MILGNALDAVSFQLDGLHSTGQGSTGQAASGVVACMHAAGCAVQQRVVTKLWQNTVGSSQVASRTRLELVRMGGCKSFCVWVIAGTVVHTCVCLAYYVLQ
jgi:hypothetical protein